MQEATELRPGDGDGVGSVTCILWRSLLHYRVQFEVTTRRVERPHLLAMRLASLTGWLLAPLRAGGPHRGPLRVERFHDHGLMNLLAPLARPAFECDHDWVMRRGGEGIARLLGCELLVCD